MAEKNNSNYITSTKNITVGDRKRSVFIIKPKSGVGKKSSTNKVSSVTVKKSRGCSGCSRRRKAKSG